MSEPMSAEELKALKAVGNGEADAASVWLKILLDSKQAKSGGVVRRSRESMLRHCDLATLQQAVYDECYHLIEAGGSFLIICTQEPIKVHC